MTLVDMRCAFVQMQRPVQNVNVVAKLCLELLNELGDDAQQVLCRSVFIQRSKLVDTAKIKFPKWEPDSAGVQIKLRKA